jgi:hypothetical protein
MYFRNLPQFLKKINQKGKRETSSTVVGWLSPIDPALLAWPPGHFGPMARSVARLSMT